MKVCIQCRSLFPDENLFCLIDGTALSEATDGQQTIIRSSANVGGPVQNLPNLSVVCGACGLSNRANSKFCKKCGNFLSIPPLEASSIPPPPTPLDLRIDLNEESQTMRNQSTDLSFSNNSATDQPILRVIGSQGRAHNNQFLVWVAVTVIAGILGIGVYRSQVETTSYSSSTVMNTSGGNRNANRANFSINTNYAPATIGRTGRLTTNQRIRSASNKYSEILGVHYGGARVEILGQDSYSTDEGYATWYRVRVIENGCDVEGVRGCGNDLDGYAGGAALEGWMNAKFIILE